MILLCGIIWLQFSYLLKNSGRDTYQKLFYIGVTIMHFTMCFVGCFMLPDLPNNDATKFYEAAINASNWIDLVGLGNKFIPFLIAPFLKLGVHLSLLFLLFASISYQGLIYYFKLLKIDFTNRKALIFSLFYLTGSIHFWTGFMGKEALLFLLMVLVLNYLKKGYFKYQLLLLLLVIFLIRPHVGIVLVVTYVITIMFDESINLKHKQLVVLISGLGGAVLLFVFLVYFLKIDALSLDAIKMYANDFLQFTEQPANASISIRETLFIQRVSYLLVMPLPFLNELNSKTQWIAAIENVYFVGVLCFSGALYLKQGFKFKIKTAELRFSIIAALLLIILFASYLYNFGLANRMRVMFLPYLFYFLIMTLTKDSAYEKEIN